MARPRKATNESVEPLQNGESIAEPIQEDGIAEPIQENGIAENPYCLLYQTILDAERKLEELIHIRCVEGKVITRLSAIRSNLRIARENLKSYV